MYKKEQEFTRFFSEGEVLPVDAFLTQEGYDISEFGGESDMIRFIEQEPCQLGLV